MKYVDEFRDGELARNISANIAREADPKRTYRLMEFCGGHTHAISRYGIADLLPPNVRMIHGPGCPVCVLPIGNYMTQVQSLLDSSDSPPALSADMSSFQRHTPQIQATRRSSCLISAGQNLASVIASISEKAMALKTNVQSDLQTSVSSLNQQLATVQTLNVQITAAIARHQSTTNLEDARDWAINKIAQYTDVTVLQRENGQVALYTSSGVAMLDGESQHSASAPTAIPFSTPQARMSARP